MWGCTILKEDTDRFLERVLLEGKGQGGTTNSKFRWENSQPKEILRETRRVGERY